MAGGETIQVDHLPDDFLQDLDNFSQDEPLKTEFHHNIHPLIPAMQSDHSWLNVYEKNGRNVSATAKALNISRNTLYKRLREQGLR